MAALVPLSMQTIFDPLKGKPLSGAKIFFYDAGTTTPKVVYKDPLLQNAHPQPVLANGAGRIPVIYVGEGNYKVEICTPAGVVIDSADDIQGEVVVTGGGGGGGGEVDPTTILQTGMIIMRHGTGTLSGFVRLNGRTIGSATSGASEMAAAGAKALFEYLWNADPNLVVYGQGGATPATRGASALADWNANRHIALPDWRGKSPTGRDSMGGGNANVLRRVGTITITNGSRTATPGNLQQVTVGDYVTATGVPSGTTVTAVNTNGTITLSVEATASSAGIQAIYSPFSDPDLLGATAGSILHQLAEHEHASHQHANTASIGESGAHTHTGTTNTTGSHTHTAGNGGGTVAPDRGDGSNQVAAAGTSSQTTSTAGNHSHTVTIPSSGQHTHPVTVTNVDQGQDAVHRNLHPVVLTTFYMKL